jgi:hypothetical protein
MLDLRTSMRRTFPMVVAGAVALAAVGAVPLGAADDGRGGLCRKFCDNEFIGNCPEGCSAGQVWFGNPHGLLISGGFKQSPPWWPCGSFGGCGLPSTTCQSCPSDPPDAPE